MSQRTIKFRVWDKFKKTYIPSDKYAIINRTDFNAFGVMISDWEDYQEGEYFYDQWQILEQFTGLLDKHGNEVWEGDRFGYGDEDPSKFTVIYSEKNGMFGIHYDGWDDDACVRLESHTFEMTQRIGNIHDHEPEN